MLVLDFQTVLVVGGAVSALLSVVCLLLSPVVGGSPVTRMLAAGNLCFTGMLGMRLVAGESPSSLCYAAIWSLLVIAGASHAFALNALSRPGALAPRRDAAALVGTIAVLTAVSWSSDTPHAAAIVTGTATAAYGLAAVRGALALRGTALAVPRRTLVAGFGAGAVFAVLHVVKRLTELLRGDDTMTPTAYTYFGAVLLFCVVNAGFLVLMYLQLAQRVANLAQTDELTGALNRRGFFERVARLRDPSSGAARAGALVLIDIDRFKAINDTHGHAVGDEVLRWFARTLRGFMRGDDLLVRMGGEEFCLLLPCVDDEHARGVAERIRAAFEAQCVAPTTGGALRVTASFGVARYGADDVALDAPLRRADDALYAAKRSGRNRVERWLPAMAPASA